MGSFPSGLLINTVTHTHGAQFPLTLDKPTHSSAKIKPKISPLPSSSGLRRPPTPRATYTWRSHTTQLHILILKWENLICVQPSNSGMFDTTQWFFQVLRPGKTSQVAGPLSFVHLLVPHHAARFHSLLCVNLSCFYLKTNTLSLSDLSLSLSCSLATPFTATVFGLSPSKLIDPVIVVLPFPASLTWELAPHLIWCFHFFFFFFSCCSGISRMWCSCVCRKKAAVNVQKWWSSIWRLQCKSRRKRTHAWSRVARKTFDGGRNRSPDLLTLKCANDWRRLY